MQDANRNAEMERLNLTVLRFSNDEVLNEFTSVLERIDAWLRKYQR